MSVTVVMHAAMASRRTVASRADEKARPCCCTEVHHASLSTIAIYVIGMGTNVHVPLALLSSFIRSLHLSSLRFEAAVSAAGSFPPVRVRSKRMASVRPDDILTRCNTQTSGSHGQVMPQPSGEDILVLQRLVWVYLSSKVQSSVCLCPDGGGY